MIAPEDIGYDINGEISDLLVSIAENETELDVLEAVIEALEGIANHCRDEINKVQAQIDKVCEENSTEYERNHPSLTPQERNPSFRSW